MQIKSKWTKSIACVYILISVAGCITAGEDFVDYGTHNGFHDVRTERIEMCTDNTTCNDIQDILSKYALDNNTQVVPYKFDCANVAEIIWYLMEKNGYTCDLAANGGYSKTLNARCAHMFVWVRTENGTVVVETTFGTYPHKRIGTVIRERDAFYETAWVFGSPTECKSRTPTEVTGITLDTPIEELPIRRKE